MGGRFNSVSGYATFGVLFGLGFPATAFLIDGLVLRAQWMPLDDLIATNPLHLIIMMAPLVLGLVFAVLGRERHRGFGLQQATHSSERTFRLLVEGVTDYAIYMLDRAGHVMSWNAGAERFKGYSADEIVGAHFSRFYCQEDRDAGLPASGLATALAEGKFEAEGWRYRKDGSRFWAQVVIDPIYDERGVHLGYAKITRDRTEQKEARDRIEHLARHDPLTGLPNRLLYLERLDWSIETARQQGSRLAVLNIDLDRFKEINDTHGHASGDRLLQILSERLTKDLAPDAFVARFGGDEFVAFKMFQTAEEIEGFAKTLRDRLTEKVHLGELEICPSGSIGVAIYPTDATDRDALIANADLAMYRAKDSLDTPVCFFEAAMDEVARARRALAADLRTALAEGQFLMNYQEQRAVGSEDVVGYEALLRWHHPKRGLVPPAEFIPVAEETGSIVAIGNWVIQTVCREAARSAIQKKIAINISPLQLSEGSLVETVRLALLESGLNPSRLELEVTESAIIADKQQALHTLRQLKATGVSIAIDDFGTGYSSLDTLRSFPFDRIKVDRSFVVGLERDRQSQAILRAILALGKSLEVNVLVEGVETRHQMTILASEGCDEVQGFLFGRPATFETLLAAPVADGPDTTIAAA